MERKGDAAVLAVLLAVAVAGVEDVVDLFGIEGDEAEAVGDELVGEDGCVGFDFDKVDGHGGHFGEDDAPEGVGEGEVDVAEGEVHMVSAGLEDCLF